MDFGQRLKLLRNEKKITQDELALHLGVGRATVAGYETKGKQPSFEILEKLADCFGVTLDYLLARTDDRTEINVPEENVHKDNDLYRSYDEIFNIIKNKLYENGIINSKDIIPPDVMGKILKYGVEAASEIIKARKENITD